mmetsp:Transcript_33098/g.72088  ORF Transcript_33098/g.72088 Transcript_33098/m.72088 type:complete len:418 (-) Transcript_33098:84-1337(-)|eukprot:CAMPEP_0170600008 /NCGR_PEP_ID=MMETSP0224-20130122/17107_1 /TAXON_ID=285029 /ORGANISM="Togula jolla, Strain CCCM 725" /LENGTH=417 /DNA_ID=CAMNT_0010924709 /DNA_START=73 /DNA_END=1326 /DNA_ORIENTATION=-
MSRRGQISIDKIVALRSSVLPLYVIVGADGTVTAADEVSEDGNDFLTTQMYGDQISFRSISGDFLSTEGGEVSTRRYCSADERFQVEKRDTQYAFRTRYGKYLSMQDHAPFMRLADQAEETEVFQLFSLILNGVNVGNQLEALERSGSTTLEGLLDEGQISDLRNDVAENGGMGDASPPTGHETRAACLAGRSIGLARLASYPAVLQLVRRLLSPAARLSGLESCRTDADFVRKELEVTSWHVVHPYSSAEYPGVIDARMSLTATWFLDDLDSSNSTWSWVRPTMTDGAHVPRLPHLSSPEEVSAVVGNAQPLTARRGSVMLYVGPMWMSNNIGAASFWKDYDAQTRYKHLSGQKEQSSFRSLTDAQRSAPIKEELCPVFLQATYVREYVALRDEPPSPLVLADLGEHGAALARLLP